MTVSELIDQLEGFPHDAVVEMVDDVEDMNFDIDKVEMEDGTVFIIVK